MQKQSSQENFSEGVQKKSRKAICVGVQLLQVDLQLYLKLLSTRVVINRAILDNLDQIFQIFNH